MFQECHDFLHQRKLKKTLMVRHYPVARPVECLDRGVPFPLPEKINVSLTVAYHCLGKDPHALRLPSNPT